MFSEVGELRRCYRFALHLRATVEGLTRNVPVLTYKPLNSAQPRPLYELAFWVRQCDYQQLFLALNYSEGGQSQDHLIRRELYSALDTAFLAAGVGPVVENEKYRAWVTDSTTRLGLEAAAWNVGHH